MEKTYITVEKEDGTSEEMEVIMAFKLEESGKDCLIYKSNVDNKYYAASYNKDLDYTDLDTNFTDREKDQIQAVFNTFNGGGIKNGWFDSS